MKHYELLATLPAALFLLAPRPAAAESIEVDGHSWKVKHKEVDWDRPRDIPHPDPPGAFELVITDDRDLGGFPPDAIGTHVDRRYYGIPMGRAVFRLEEGDVADLMADMLVSAGAYEGIRIERVEAPTGRLPRLEVSIAHFWVGVPVNHPGTYTAGRLSLRVYEPGGAAPVVEDDVGMGPGGNPFRAFWPKAMEAMCESARTLLATDAVQAVAKAWVEPPEPGPATGPAEATEPAEATGPAETTGPAAAAVWVGALRAGGWVVGSGLADGSHRGICVEGVLRPNAEFARLQRLELRRVGDGWFVLVRGGDPIRWGPRLAHGDGRLTTAVGAGTETLLLEPDDLVLEGPWAVAEPTACAPPPAAP